MVEPSREIIVLGSSNTDIVVESPHLPVAGETVLAPGYSIFAGGKGANQAVAAARAGGSIRFVGAIGDDQFGADRMADLERAGVDVQAVTTLNGMQSGLALIVVDENGENIIVNAAGTNDRIPTDAIERAIQATDHGLLLMTLEAPLETMQCAIQLAESQDWPVVINAAPFRDDAADLLASATVLICNEVEAKQAAPALADRSGTDLAEGLGQTLGNEVVVTLGKDGCAIAGPDRAAKHLATISVEAVDSTGAGDAFCGALAAWLARGSTLTEACKAANIAGAISATRRGAQASSPARSEIEQRLGELT